MQSKREFFNLLMDYRTEKKPEHAGMWDYSKPWKHGTYN